MKHKIQFNNWDNSQIPLPFTRALVLMAPPIYVARDATEDEVKTRLLEVQTVLDRMRLAGDSYWDIHDTQGGKSPS